MGTAAGATGGLAGAASLATPYVNMGLGALNIFTDLAQAGQQEDAAKAAQRTAETAAREQERLLSQDFFKGLQMPMEAYGRAARETTAQVGQLVGALQEGDPRFLPGGVGKVAAAGIAGEADTRDAMAQEIYKRELAQAQSATNVNTNLAKLEEQRLAGAQKSAAEARAAELGLYSGAAQAGAGILNTGLGMIDSFGMDATAPVKSNTPALDFWKSFNKAPDWQAATSYPITKPMNTGFKTY